MSQGELRPGRWKKGQFHYGNRRRNNNMSAAGNSSNWYNNNWPQIRDQRTQRGRGQRSHRFPFVWNRHGTTTDSQHQGREKRGQLVRAEEDDASDEEAKSEKRKTANILRTRLLSLSDEYKSNSIRQLIEDPTETESLAMVAKPTECEKQARRIAHVPKPIKPSQPSSNPSPPTELRNDCIGPSSPVTAVQVRKTPKEQFMQNLMQDLITKSPDYLKRMATDPRSSEIAIFRRFTAIHRSQMSEAMRKLAEHKLQNDASPLLLEELEQLVQADTVTDMCNMSLETLQCLQEIFDLHCTYDNQSEATALSCPKTEPSVDFSVDDLLNESSFQLEDSCIRSVPPCYEMGTATQISHLSVNPLNSASPLVSALHELEAATDIVLLPTPSECLSSSGSFLNKPTKKRGKKNLIRKSEKLCPTETHKTRETQTDAKLYQEISSQTEEEPDSCYKLLTDVQNLLDIMSSCDEDSRILQSTAVSCIAGLIQNFTKQFSELNSRKNTKLTEESDAFLDPGGTIKRIKITGPYQSGLKLPTKRPLEVIIDQHHSVSPVDQDKMQSRNYFVNCNGEIENASCF